MSVTFTLNSDIPEATLEKLETTAIEMLKEQIRRKGGNVDGFDEWLAGDGAKLSTRERIELIVGVGVGGGKGEGYLLRLHDWGCSPSEVFAGIPPEGMDAALAAMERRDRSMDPDKPPRVERLW